MTPGLAISQRNTNKIATAISAAPMTMAKGVPMNVEYGAITSPAPARGRLNWLDHYPVTFAR